MRFLVYLLLLANVGMLAWISLQPVQQAPAYIPIPVPPGIAPLVLLSERVPASEDKDDSSALDISLDTSAAGEIDAQEDELGEQSPEPESIVAVIETADEVEAIPQPSQPVEVERICLTIGPLWRERDTNAITEQLATSGYDATQRGGEVREPSGYWVYMPAMPAGEARRIVAKLDANGMKDYFIGKRNYISLGIFSRKDKAQTRLEQVKALGFNAVLDQRYRTRNVLWLDLEEGDQPLLGSPVWQQIQAEHTDIRVQRVSCE